MTWPMMARLGERDRASLLAVGTVRTFRNREAVFRAGDVGDSMYVIRQGRVAVRIDTEAGEQSTLVILGPGDTFGELALLRAERRRSATVIAIARTTALMLPRDALAVLRADRPDIDDLFIDLLLRQIRLLTGQLLEARYVPVRQRVVRVLLRLCSREAARHKGRPIELVITQEDVAGLVGAARPTVNKELRILETEGVIALDRGQITVVALDALRSRR